MNLSLKTIFSTNTLQQQQKTDKHSNEQTKHKTKETKNEAATKISQSLVFQYNKLIYKQIQSYAVRLRSFRLLCRIFLFTH